MMDRMWSRRECSKWAFGGLSTLVYSRMFRPLECFAEELPKWIVFPEKEWKQSSPEEVGLDPAKWKKWVERQKPTGNESWGQNPKRRFGVVVARGGHLLETFGDPHYKLNSASVGKAFTSFALQLAIDAGLIEAATDPIQRYWTGAGQLDAESKRMDRGHHRSLSCFHLHSMKGGFPLTNGWHWKNKRNIPKWAKWTGNPTADNYAHIAPGTRGHYSSGGRWRLSQALTAVWKRELKAVLDEKLFRHIGIEPGAWRWETGKVLHDNEKWYPKMPGYGSFCDPPYSIGGQRVQGGGGWVKMSASDLARVGLLVATRGVWKGKRLIGDSVLVRGHGGGNSSLMNGWTDTLFSWGQVTASRVSPNGLPETLRK